MKTVNRQEEGEYQRGFKAGHVLGMDKYETDMQRARSEGEAEGSDRTLKGCYDAIKYQLNSGVDSATKIERINDVLKRWKRELVDRELFTPDTP